MKLDTPTTIDREIPLIVDVDGTLIGSDLTHDLLFLALSRQPKSLLTVVKSALKSKAALKETLVDLVGDHIDPLFLPYNKAVTEMALAHSSNGGKVILCSGSHQSLVNRISDHLDFVSEGYGTTNSVNLTKVSKAQFLSEKFPDGFHYVGNSSHDYAVWAQATSGSAVNPPNSIKNIKTLNGDNPNIIMRNKLSLKTLFKCIRIHQWVKNGLIGLVPILSIASLTEHDVYNVVVGFFSLSFLVSATYILNDLLDVTDDRQHPSKKTRPIACGAVSVPHALMLMIFLAGLSGLSLLILPVQFGAVLAIYLFITVAYSIFWKKVILLDVITLAGLFIIRVVAGAAIIVRELSPWLLSFVATFFFSLALLKRYIELRKSDQNARLPGRGYLKSDEPIVLSLGVMAMGLSLLSFLLYGILAQDGVISSQFIIFAFLGILTYWMMRMWLLAHRNILDDDPVLFAVRDRTSLFLGAVIVLFVILEQVGLV